MPKLSFVIPCYGSENTITSVTNDIKKTLQTKPKYEYEIILVNDSSPDNVYNVIRDLAKNDPCIKGIDLAKNFGQHSALMTGYRYVTGDIIVCMDDDGQTPASEIFKLIDTLDEGYDVVFAKYPNKKHSFSRNFGSKINDFMARALIGKPKKLAIMSYFCCRRFIIDEIVRYENPFPYIAGLLLRSTNKIENVEIEHHERISGASGYTFKKLLSLWVNGFTAFSVKPLRIATIIGAFSAFLGFLYGIYIILNKLIFNPAVPLGYSSLLATTVFFGGLILLTLGLIGEYIGRIYIGLNKSPQSVIRQTINLGESNENQQPKD